MRVCLWLGLIFFCSSVLAALPETPQFRQVTVADGLPSSTLYAVTQDRKGYIWIASKDGLARYDGVGYKIYRYAPGDANSLPGNVIQVLHVDNQDRLWIAAEGQGISRLSADRTEFTHYRKSTHPEMGSDDVWAMASTSDGALWFGTYDGGLHRMDAKGKIRRFISDKNDPDSLPSNTILSLTVDKRERLWVGTTKGLCLWNRQKCTNIRADESVNGFVMQLVTDRDGSIWAGTNKGLLHFSASGVQIGEIILKGKPITGLWQDREAAILFSDGPNFFQFRNQRLSSYTPDAQFPAKIYGVFEDHEGGIWLPTEDRGLYKISMQWRDFHVAQHTKYRDSLSGNLVFASAESDESHVWLATKLGLDRVSLNDGTVERILKNTEVSTTQLWAVIEAKDGSAWLGHNNGLARFDPKMRTIVQIENSIGQQKSLIGPVRLLIQTPDDLIWSASYGGGVEAHDVAGKLVHRIVPNDGRGLQSADPDQFAVSPDGELWLATAEGLLHWDGNLEKFLAIEGGPRDRVDAFCFLSANMIWAHHNGVLEAFQWDGKKLRSLRRVTGANGLPPLEVGSILPDETGSLWLTTPRGLLRYSTLTGQLRMFGERDGLPSQEFDMQPALLTSDKLVLAGTSKGLVMFDPARIRSQSNLSPLVADAISVRRGEDKINFSPELTVLDIQPDDRDLTIRLRLLSFVDATKQRYRFLLKGYDSDWVDVGAQGERTFSTLPAGSYVLQARAADAEGRWSVPLLLKLVVHPPWWKTAWAKCLWFLTFCFTFLLLAWLYGRRLQLLHAQRMRDQEREIAQLHSSAKSRFLATLGHEIRTPMTGVLGMAELLQAGELSTVQRHRVSAIQSASQHLLRLVNDVLDLSQIEAGKLHLQDTVFDVKALIHESSMMLKPSAELKGLVLNCVIEENTPDFCMGDAGRIRQILLNLGNNAIKFTAHGWVEIRVSGILPHGIKLQVSDTGPGMNEEQQTRLFQRFEQAEGSSTYQRYGGHGLGLAICQELAVAMGGHIEVQSSPGEGALFKVLLPLRIADSTTEKDEAPDPKQYENRALKVLLVEDDLLVAEVLVDLLRDLGHEVTHAYQALQALAELSAHDFDVALLDLDLPGMDGIELARLIQAKGCSMPLVAITARVDDEVESAIMSAGMKAMLRKPVGMAGLQKLLLTVVVTVPSV